MANSILIIDDNRTIRQQVREILHGTELFENCHEAGDGIEGFKILLSEKIDIILCDLEMPGMDGYKFLRMVASREELMDIPVILLTSHEEQEAKIRGLEAGASDYVTKPFFPAELLARVKVQLKIKSLQDSLKQSNLQLKELSQTDALTGLANRRQLMNILAIEFERSRRTGTPFSILMIDLDHFKKINDNYGHQDGDVVLRSTAELMLAHLRQYDTAARFGGEEFTLVLPETDPVEAAGVAERIRKEISKMTFTGSIAKLKLTASIGVATVPKDNIGSLDDFLRAADDALYQAKNNGRNRVEVLT
ncbi:MAG: diguanylate cyclase response regulator [Desulfuromonas sp.]|nr:MAG: diguanylate cyclase response regulator [Desulfuromonas sp.]